MEKKDWEQRLKEKWYLWNYNKELGNYTTCENEVIDFIQAELDKAREEGYEECKKDMAVGVGLAVDTEFSKIVSKIASKLTTK